MLFLLLLFVAPKIKSDGNISPLNYISCYFNTLQAPKIAKDTDPNSHWCQPLLTAVAESINASTACKNALRQTFGPAMHVLNGPNLW